MGALHQYARALTNEGAHPSTLIIPTLPGQKKTGPDDYVIAHGIDAFKQLPVERFLEIEALWEINSKFAVVIDPPSVLKLHNNKLTDHRKFVGLIVANRQIIQIDAKGNPKPVQAGRRGYDGTAGASIPAWHTNRA